MMGATHLGMGLSAALAYHLTTPLPSEAAVVIGGCAVIGSLLPDIDKGNTPIRQLLGLPGHLLLFWIPHRGPTHSLVAVFVIGLIAASIHPVVGITITLAYASHLISDAMTLSGIPFFWPCRRPVHLLPHRLRLRVQGRAERLLQFGLSSLILVELLLTLGIVSR